MNKKENKNVLQNALNDLKKMVFGKESKSITSKVRYKFEITETSEGQSISYPVLEVGAPVTIGNGEGGDVAPDGWYAIDEATEIRVEAGVIAEIKQPEVVEESAEDFEDENADAPAEDSKVAEKVIEVVEQAQEQIEALSAEIETLKAEFAKVLKTNDDVKALTDAVAKFSKEPVAVSVTKENNKDNKLNQLAGILGKK
ncbi:hypothetical protein [Sphingobacterium sp. 1.A.5]|uniref:hypothetical protein n=1 Tax=Sphingobacterium sp. 1.A.5 TaxID=2044604 RepID=UPI000C0C0CBB|nr:hypothetical protein [Sphingobacterium sp. 1.A.5]